MRTRWRVPLTCLAFLLPMFLGIIGSPDAADGTSVPLDREPTIRIGLIVDTGQIIISCDGKLRVWRRGSGLRASVLGPGVKLRLLPTMVAHTVWEASSNTGMLLDWGLALSEVRQGMLGVFVEELIFEPISPGKPIRVDGKPYRGEILVRVSRPDALTVINALHIEDYLRGVVPPEMGSSPDLPAAVLRAQAIASRSYALFYLGRHAKKGFDLQAGVNDQVYGGISVETEPGTRAVISTSGFVAVHKGRAIRANYSSTCGGTTEASGRVWPGEVFPYLRPVRDRGSGGKDFCEWSPNYRWTETWNCTELEKTILKRLPEEVPQAVLRAPSKIKGMKVTKRSPSGRAEVLEVKTNTGTFRVKGDRIRWVLRRPDGRPLRSTLFKRLKKHHKSGCTVTLEGAGYGHGVGMCQTGAIAMARHGRTAPQILRHYYRGITLEKWW